MKAFYSEFNNEECCLRMLYAGPMYSGKLWDARLVDKMVVNCSEKIYADALKLLNVISEEAKINCQWHYNIHLMSKKLKTKIPRTEELLSLIKKEGYCAARTHFSDKSIRTDMPIEKLTKLMK